MSTSNLYHFQTMSMIFLLIVLPMGVFSQYGPLGKPVISASCLTDGASQDKFVEIAWEVDPTLEIPSSVIDFLLLSCFAEIKCNSSDTTKAEYQKLSDTFGCVHSWKFEIHPDYDFCQVSVSYDDLDYGLNVGITNCSFSGGKISTSVPSVTTTTTTSTTTATTATTSTTPSVPVNDSSSISSALGKPVISASCLTDGESQDKFVEIAWRVDPTLEIPSSGIDFLLLSCCAVIKCNSSDTTKAEYQTLSDSFVCVYNWKFEIHPDYDFCQVSVHYDDLDYGSNFGIAGCSFSEGKISTSVPSVTATMTTATITATTSSTTPSVPVNDFSSISDLRKPLIEASCITDDESLDKAVNITWKQDMSSYSKYNETEGIVLSCFAVINCTSSNATKDNYLRLSNTKGCVYNWNFEIPLDYESCQVIVEYDDLDNGAFSATSTCLFTVPAKDSKVPNSTASATSTSDTITTATTTTPLNKGSVLSDTKRSYSFSVEANAAASPFTGLPISLLTGFLITAIVMYF